MVKRIWPWRVYPLDVDVNCSELRRSHSYSEHLYTVTYKNGMRNLVPNILKSILLLILCPTTLASENLEQKLHHIGEEAHISICITPRGELTISIFIFFIIASQASRYAGREKPNWKSPWGYSFTWIDSKSPHVCTFSKLQWKLLLEGIVTHWSVASVFDPVSSWFALAVE